MSREKPPSSTPALHEKTQVPTPEREVATNSVDVVEAALAAAIERTSDPAALIALTAELRARREARAGVVHLDAERVKCGR